MVITVFTHSQQYRSSRPEVFCKKGVLKNFAKFTGKHLYQSFFFSKNAGQARFRKKIVNFTGKDLQESLFNFNTGFFLYFLWTFSEQLFRRAFTGDCFCIIVSIRSDIFPYIFFFYLGFLSRTFTIHGTAGEGGGYLFNSSLPLPPASQALRH